MIVILCIIGYIFHMCILSWVIGQSIGRNKSNTYEKIKIRLLIRLLRKNGIPDEEINAVVGKEASDIIKY